MSMTAVNGDMVLDIENDVASADSHEAFTPRSITERALALGGRVSVDVNNAGRTIVSVIIPM